MFLRFGQLNTLHRVESPSAPPATPPLLRPSPGAGASSSISQHSRRTVHAKPPPGRRRKSAPPSRNQPTPVASQRYRERPPNRSPRSRQPPAVQAHGAPPCDHSGICSRHQDRQAASGTHPDAPALRLPLAHPARPTTALDATMSQRSRTVNSIRCRCSTRDAGRWCFALC